MSNRLRHPGRLTTLPPVFIDPPRRVLWSALA